MPAQCATIPGESEGELRYVVLLQEQEAMLKAMMQEVDIAIAFPTQGGQVDVMVLSMNGIRSALSEILPASAVTEEAPASARTTSIVESAPEMFQL